MAALQEQIAAVAPFANTDEQGDYTGDIHTEQDND